jgi:hypothetical protein
MEENEYANTQSLVSPAVAIKIGLYFHYIVITLKTTKQVFHGIGLWP